MGRKSLIICLAVLAAMIVGVGIAITVLYSGTDSGLFGREKKVADENRYLLLPAIPADAVFVACLSDSDLADSLSFKAIGIAPEVPMTVSLHYNGHLQTLYVFDAGRTSETPSGTAETILKAAKLKGMYAEHIDCSKLTDGRRGISKRSIVLASDSETLLKSSKRHLGKSVSVMDASGFVEASSAAPGSDIMFFSNFHAKMLMEGMFSKKYASSHPFVSSMAQWTVAEISKADASGLTMSIYPVYGGDSAEYMTVLASSQAETSRLSEILPSYTVSAVSLPLKGLKSYSDAYLNYMDSKQSLQSFRKRQRELKDKTGISPEDFFRRMDIREAAKASFVTGGVLEEVNLLRINEEDTLLFRDTDIKSFKNYKPALHPNRYASFISSVFGKYFALKDETFFTYMNGWVVSGSRKAVEEYVSGRALDYRLVEYMADAGQKDMLGQESTMNVYHSFTEYPEVHKEIFSKDFCSFLEPFHEGCDYCPLVMNMTHAKDGLRMNVRIPKLNMQKTKAPDFVRDTTVAVPLGPFRVKNSATRKTNLFYQNAHGSLCLMDEGGKGLWGVPFDGKLCGTAHNVDYYANGKLQIIFGSGSRIYIIDRLGRFVSGFPLDLGKEILLGPDVYDFNNKKAYNIMVLHKDNTIDMYNLKGRKPASWKSIAGPETIKTLPERIIVGGKTFWVVRTAIQTLIYPFDGGAPITDFKGDQMILPDSEIKILDSSSVSAECYDGKIRTVKLK